MKIKTPVQFVADGRFYSLDDADGNTLLFLDSPAAPNPETRQSIIDAFENSARWEFLMAAFDDENGPEALAGKAVEDQFPDDEAMTSAVTVNLVDAARAYLAAKELDSKQAQA